MTQVYPMSRADLQVEGKFTAPSQDNQRSSVLMGPELPCKLESLKLICKDYKERYEIFLRTGDDNGVAVSWKIPPKDSFAALQCRRSR